MQDRGEGKVFEQAGMGIGAVPGQEMVKMDVPCSWLNTEARIADDLFAFNREERISHIVVHQKIADAMRANLQLIDLSLSSEIRERIDGCDPNNAFRIKAMPWVTVHVTDSASLGGALISLNPSMSRIVRITDERYFRVLCGPSVPDPLGGRRRCILMVVTNGQSCEQCRFWSRGGSCAGDGGTMNHLGTCHRLPPTVLMNSMMGHWPVTSSDSWCGEFQFPSTSTSFVPTEYEDEYR